jgi:hypothetical protein
VKTRTASAKLLRQLRNQSPNGNTAKDEHSGDEVPSISTDSWPDPVSLEIETVPPFPVNELPAWLAEWADAESRALQVPLDLPGMLGLGFAGAGIAGKFRVEPRDGWIEPTNAFVAVALPPGERKTAVFSDALKPIAEYEAEQLALAKPLIAEAASQHRVLELKLKQAETNMAKAKTPEEKRKLGDDRRDLARELEAHVVPDLPQAYADDVTPEKLATLLASQGGRMLQASAEGTLFEICKGRYSQTANFDVYLKGHAGDPLRVQRVSRDADTVDRPALSIAVAVQPDVIAGLAGQASMRGRGFLARWWYSVPLSRVGTRQIAAPSVSASISNRYAAAMLTLWRLTPPQDAEGRPTPYVLRFTAEADEKLKEFERWLEPQLTDGEELAHLAGWANKLAGAIVRIAGILHVATAVGAGAMPSLTIDADIVEKAVRIGRDYLLPHALAAFGVMGADSSRAGARSVWASVARRYESSESSESAPLTLSRRDLHQLNRRLVDKVEDMDPLIELLIDANYLRPAAAESTHPGRGHASPRFEVNPKALRMALEKRASPSHCTQRSHSESVTAENGGSECSEYSETTSGPMVEQAEGEEGDA